MNQLAYGALLLLPAAVGAGIVIFVYLAVDFPLGGDGRARHRYLIVASAQTALAMVWAVTAWFSLPGIGAVIVLTILMMGPAYWWVVRRHVRARVAEIRAQLDRPPAAAPPDPVDPADDPPSW